MDRRRFEMGGVFELANPTEQLLAEIGDEVFTRTDVAKTYRLAMQSSHPTRWPEVNRAIIARWSESALMWIKRQAHSGRCFSGKVA